MLLLRVTASAIVTSALLLGTPPLVRAQSGTNRMMSIAELEAAARARTSTEARSALGAVDAVTLTDAERLEPGASGRTPNYVRALAPITGAPQSFAALLRTFLYDGLLAPEVKIMMGLRVAQVNASPYVGAHLHRFLKATPRGRALLEGLTANTVDTLKTDERLALKYAEALTRDIHGITDAEFARVRAAYNDGQIVELTMVVAFFNYFTRLAEALHLPVEPWVLSTAFVPPASSFERPLARVNLISDRQLGWAASVASKTGSPAPVPLANSQRAMMLTPALGTAWMTHMRLSSASRGVDAALKLHVSFAVSSANGCRYCTLHQVQGLRREGVAIDKLLAMEKDDAALTDRERTAVEFARVLTRDASASDADVLRLRKTFGDQGALEVVLQTCTFAFMNRFTDNLRLPSEDEAVAVYRQTYGRDHPASR